MYLTISVNTAEPAFNDALAAWQDWSDATFDDQYRAAILTLIEGLASLTGYLIGVACCWLLLQCVRTVRYWLAEAVQAVPVLHGWWRAPSIEAKATQYPESCWQAIAPAVTQAILDYELEWAIGAEAIVRDMS